MNQPANQRNMITKQQAIEIVRAVAGAKLGQDVQVTDGLPPGCNPYGAPTKCWAVRFSRGIPMMLCSSRLICISKDDGRVLYDGSADDEG